MFWKGKDGGISLPMLTWQQEYAMEADNTQVYDLCPLLRPVRREVSESSGVHSPGADFIQQQKKIQDISGIPSRELTYPPKMAFWRWFSFSQGGIC